jgi:hypothetical protein
MLKHRFYFAFALVTAAAAGCGGGGDTGGAGGDSSTSSSKSSSSASSSSGMGGAINCPPGEGTVLAANKLYIGEGTMGEWKNFGFNIDGKTTIASSMDVCKPNAGGMASTAYPDGNNGIDNSFGKNILPSILIFSPTFATNINTSLQSGAFTMMMKMACLPPTGDVSPLVTKLFGGTPLGMAPKFDGTDMWPVAPELLTDPKDPDSSKVVFGMSSVTGTLFDSGKNQTFILTVPLNIGMSSTSLTLTVHAAQVTMNLAADRKSATGGIIGGVLNTEEFIAEVKKVGYAQKLCGPLLDGLLTQMRQASDIMSDGSQDPAKTCDGISIGLGFDLKEVQIGVVGPATPPGMACP